ncbi:Haloacid dehalogenase [Methylacidimicrobium sp. AP8]|uniref:HAD family hydrolase n=1 Tax=Methylacidimicrobium sp. AP8 TaxID=2730359 RepID=UPI0018C0530B|nr:HAD hydrolase family protein [Methylacidimicrobium sp. AP8]CAB4244469.1 Haloacid dehalogenase [Methylacidimicrobium sp. AP8]
MSLRLVCTDFDGTLLPAGEEADRSVCAEFFSRLERLKQEKGVIWVINTGRPWESLCRELERLRFPYWPDWVVLGEREVYRIERRLPIPHRAWNERCSALHRELFAATAAFWEGMRHFLRNETRAVYDHAEWSPLEILASDAAEADRIHEKILDWMAPFPELSVQRNFEGFRFSHREIHKGSALQAVQAQIGVEAAATLAAGDHHNDLPMLDRRYAAFLTCPANAIPEVKERVRSQGGFLASLPASAGVAQALSQFEA